MNLSEIIRNLLNQPKKIDVEKLPTQGMFYPKDFEIKIRKSDMKDIIEYEQNYDADNLFSVIESIKNLVRKNTVFGKNYCFDDIKSVDIVFIFLEIVKFTKNKNIQIPFYDETGNLDIIEFNKNNFNYFDFGPYLKDRDSEKGEILIDSYRFSMPSIGAENCLTRFLISKGKSKKWSEYNYDFIFFLGNKNSLTFKEIENLVTIFNFDIEDSEKEKISGIKDRFTNLVGYSLKKENQVIEMKSKLDLQTIWKN